MQKGTGRKSFTALALCALLGLAATSRAEDAIDLESVFIGDKEQPSVSYFVPWKPPEGPGRLYRPIDSVAGNILDPVDREVHTRTMKFYGELSLENAAADAVLADQILSE